MATKKKTIGVSMDADMAKELKSRAESMGIGTSKYVFGVLNQWLDSGNKLTLSE